MFNRVTIQINHIKILKMRTDSNGRCNKTLDDHDGQWMEMVSKLVGCIPPYWISMTQGINLPVCTSSLQLYKTLQFHMLPSVGKSEGSQKAIRKNKEVFKMNDPPCTQMGISTSLIQDKAFGGPNKDKPVYNVVIKFATEEYEDGQNVKEYRADNLFAEMGGYIGLFVGFSFFQGLMNIVSMITWIKKLCNTKK